MAYVGFIDCDRCGLRMPRKDEDKFETIVFCGEKINDLETPSKFHPGRKDLCPECQSGLRAWMEAAFRRDIFETTNPQPRPRGEE